MNRRDAVAIALSAFALTPALAQERPVAATMTCAAVAGLVQSKGDVVFSIGTNGFERIVRENRFCSGDEVTSPAYEQTSDQKSCFAGYRCRTWEHGDSKG